MQSACEPQDYRPMAHEDFKEDYRKFRLKSRTWSGERSKRDMYSRLKKLWDTCACSWVYCLLIAYTLPSHTRHGRDVQRCIWRDLFCWTVVFRVWFCQEFQDAINLALTFWTDPITAVHFPPPWSPFRNASLPCVKYTHNFNCPLIFLLLFRSHFKKPI